MKKSIIAASAASLAVAAMPVVGVFAAAPVTEPSKHTDILSVTIDKVCAFGYTSGTDIQVTGVDRQPGDGGNGTWGTATLDTNNNTTATLSGTMVNGTVDTDFGSTTLGIYCNNEDGYRITSAFVEADGNVSTHSGALTSSTVTDTIPVTSTIAANAATGWSYKVADKTGVTNVASVQGNYGSWSATAGDIVSSSASTPSKMTTNAGDYFTITYGVVVDEAQSAGTYTGGISYTLTQL